jgi:ERp29, N-terminal domain
VNDLLIAEVGIKDYGDFDNQEIATKFKVKKEDFPVLKLFIQGKDEPIDYGQKDFDADAIKKFIRSSSNVYIGLPGCLENFDGIASKVGDFLFSDFCNLINFVQLVCICRRIREKIVAQRGRRLVGQC